MTQTPALSRPSRSYKASDTPGLRRESKTKTYHSEKECTERKINAIQAKGDFYMKTLVILAGTVLVLDTIGTILIVSSLVFSIRKQIKEYKNNK